MEEDKPDGSTAMERLARELMDKIESSAATSWCRDHGYNVKGTSYTEDKRNARADIERRINEADLEDDRARDVALGDWKEKVAELDALKKAGRVMPEGVSWPRYEDGEPVRIGDVMRGTGRSQHIFRVVGVAPGNGRMTVVCEDVDEDCELCYTDPRLLAHERPDSWGRLREDVRKDYTAYWGCIGFCCDKCPALVDGKKPNERYDTAGCQAAEQLDLLARAERLAGVAR